MERFPPRSGPSETPPTIGVPLIGAGGATPSSRIAKKRSRTVDGWVASWVTTGPWTLTRPQA